MCTKFGLWINPIFYIKWTENIYCNYIYRATAVYEIAKIEEYTSDAIKAMDAKNTHTKESKQNFQSIGSWMLRRP